jgi:tetratricopeptide (TPR) repeat protein
MGCYFLNRDDLKTAMFRFNQAWLMNPKNPDVFRGFGYVYTRLGDHNMALKLYNEGLAIDPKNKDLLLEKSFAEKDIQKQVK